MAKQTLHTIAAALGISHVTVSLALSGSKRIAPATRQRVRDYAASIGYRPNRAAQALKRQSTKTFGYVLPGISSPFSAAIAEHLYRAAVEAGYLLQMVFSGYDLDGEQRAVEECMAMPVDGLIVSSSFDEPDDLPPEREHPLAHCPLAFPIVSTGGPWQVGSRILPAVGFDHEQSFYELTQWMLKQGCRTIFLLLNSSDRELDAAGRLHHPTLDERIAASYRALDDAGAARESVRPVVILHSFERVRVRPGAVFGDLQHGGEVDRSMVSAVLAPLLEKIERGGEPVGLLTMNDEVASMVRMECLSRGLRPGCDVVIAGCDDTLAPWVGFTSYRWDYPRFAREIIQGLLGQMEKLPVRSASRIAGEIVVRSGE